MRKLLAVMAVALLSGCQAPSPTVTAATIGASAQAQAICWSSTASTPIGEECRLDASLVRTLTVTPGEFVGFSVDKKIAESGWVISINGQRATQGILRTPYYRFTTGENTFANGPLEVEVYALTADNKARGVWAFTLESPGQR